MKVRDIQWYKNFLVPMINGHQRILDFKDLIEFLILNLI
jgi:hypothetical protein